MDHNANQLPYDLIDLPIRAMSPFCDRLDTGSFFDLEIGKMIRQCSGSLQVIAPSGTPVDRLLQMDIGGLCPLGTGIVQSVLCERLRVWQQVAGANLVVIEDDMCEPDEARLQITEDVNVWSNNDRAYYMISLQTVGIERTAALVEECYAFQLVGIVVSSPTKTVNSPSDICEIGIQELKSIVNTTIAVIASVYDGESYAYWERLCEHRNAGKQNSAEH